MTNEKLRNLYTAIPRFFKGYAVVIAAFLIMMVSWGIYYSFGIFFKPILQEFGWTRTMTSGAFSFSWLVAGLVGIFMGVLTDKYGPRLVLSICGLLAGGGYLLMSQISEFWQLYLFYGVLIGAGTSTFSSTMATIARLYVERRTIMTGIVTVGIGIGSLIVPPLANQVILTYDWRASFVTLGIITLVVVIISAQFMKRGAPNMSQATRDTNKTTTQTSAATPDVTVFTFKSAIVTRQFWIIFAMFFCLGFSVLTAQVHLVPYATDINISPTTAANILATIGGASIIGRVVLGGVGDKIGNRRAFIIGFAFMAVPVLCLVFARETWMLFLIAAVFGIGYGDCVASESPLAASVFGLKSLGLIFGFLSNAFTLGGALGPLIAAYIFDITMSYQAAFILTAVVGAIGLVLTIILSPIKAQSKG